ncbi:MAG: thioredoxin family protein [Melioribacteraceae bacterium]|nr:thioredoxin family protein [Melioribacteraceae bacterium]
MVHQFFIDKRPHNALTYEEYSTNMHKKVEETNAGELNEKEKQMFEYTKLNSHRSKRIDKTYKVDPELEAAIKSVSEKQIWMIITEDWCGDSAQNLPYIAKMTSVNKNIDFRIIERDKNLDIIDLYLTNGTSRSIPKMIAFNEDGTELFQWGPRPKEIAALVGEWKEAGIEMEEIKEKLHLWYGRNRGKSIESEFKSLLSK